MAFANSNAKETDLLITWLFTLTNDNSNYKMASVIGIISFAICALLTLLSYTRMISGDKEEVTNNEKENMENHCKTFSTCSFGNHLADSDCMAVVTSLSTTKGVSYQHFFPEHWTLANYHQLFFKTDTAANFPAWFKNTFIVAFFTASFHPLLY